MLSAAEITYLTAVAAMSHHHGSYQFLVEGADGWCYLAHRPAGHVLYTFAPTP